MHLTELSSHERTLALRAMRTVALADGDLNATEEALLETAAALLECEDIPRAPLSASDLAGVTKDSGERIVQAGILMSLMDGQVAPEEVALVRRYADGLGIDEPRVKNLGQLARGHTTRMWLDLARRSFAREVFAKELEEKGPAGVWKIVGPILGASRDPDLARRYLALGELPSDTLGYAYFRFLCDNELPFPGEAWAVPESGIWHDISHVLGEFGTSAEEELLHVSFIAGYSKDDPFFWLFTITLQFHLGIRVSPYSPSAEGLFHPQETLGEFERGAQVTEDLSAKGWDPWPYFGEPLDAVRERFGVAPRTMKPDRTSRSTD